MHQLPRDDDKLDQLWHTNLARRCEKPASRQQTVYGRYATPAASDPIGSRRPARAAAPLYVYVTRSSQSAGCTRQNVTAEAVGGLCKPIFGVLIGALAKAASSAGCDDQRT